MKLLAVTSIAFALAAPAFAQTTTTLQEVTTRGITLSAAGFEVDVTYKPDGTFTAMDDQITGKWRIDGEKLCTTSNMSPAEECCGLSGGREIRRLVRRHGSRGTATIKIK